MKLITILACNFKLISKEKMIRLAFISNTWKQLRQLDAIWLSYCFIPWRSENLIIPSMIEPLQRAHSSPLAAGLASELKIDFHPYGEDSPRLAAGRVQSNPSAVIEINKKSIINKPFGHVT